MFKYSLILISILFTACNDNNTDIISNDNNNDDNNIIIEETLNNSSDFIKGNILDNSIVGAKVCLDKNKNDICEKNEITTFSNEQGKYKFNIKKNTLENNINQIIASGGVDIISGNNFNGIYKSNITTNDTIVLNSVSTLSSFTDIKNIENILGVNNIDNKIFNIKLKMILDIYKDVLEIEENEFLIFIKSFVQNNNQLKTLEDILELVLQSIDEKRNELYNNNSQSILLKTDIINILMLSDNNTYNENTDLSNIKCTLGNKKNIIVEYINNNKDNINLLYENLELENSLSSYSSTFRILNILNIADTLKSKQYFIKNANFIFDYNLNNNSTIIDFENLLNNDTNTDISKKKFFLSIIESEKKKYNKNNTLFNIQHSIIIDTEDIK
jgi:hypothetical protein